PPPTISPPSLHDALPISWIRGALARKEKIMGFGHRVYKTGDVRAGILKEYARKAAERAGQTEGEATAAILERVLAQEKNLHPNLDRKSTRLNSSHVSISY